MSFEKKLDSVLERHQELHRLLGEGTFSSPQAFAKLSKEFSDLDPIADAIQRFKNTEKELQDLKHLLKDSTQDLELLKMAEEEVLALTKKLPDLEQNIKVLLVPKDEDDDRNAILEVRAGTGGEEAALFAGDLFRMYQRYAEHRGWTTEIMGFHETGIGGVKEASMAIKGKGVFSRLKFESGVHRVQRIPVTEAGGRIHTSAGTVAVLPEVEDVEIDLKEADLRIDVFRSSGPGGQSVNTTDSAVRVTHLPTGIVVQQQDEKSQHKNRAKALKILRARIYDLERQKRDAARAAQRKGMVGSGDRSERIRTYNFPQGRVTDHRIGLTLYKLDQVLGGDALDEMLEALITEDQATKLADVE